MKIYIEDYYFYPEFQHLLPKTSEMIWIEHDSPEMTFQRDIEGLEIRNVEEYMTDLGAPHIPDYKRFRYQAKERYRYYQYDSIFEFFKHHPDMVVCDRDGYLFVYAGDC